MRPSLILCLLLLGCVARPESSESTDKSEVAVLEAADRSPGTDLPISEGVGGPFTLPSTLGKDLSLSDLRGKPVLLYFGYSNCPDVCPLTTAHIAEVMEALGDRSDDIQVLFLTVDPEYDTVKVLSDYLSYFDKRIIGLTGTREEVDRVLNLFLAEYSKVSKMPLPLDIKVTQRTGLKTGNIYSHTARIYLLDQKGRTRALYYLGTPVEQMTEGIRYLFAAQPSVEVSQAWVRTMPPSSRVTSVYFKLRNPSDRDERLIAISSPISKHAELHQTREENGMARMFKLEDVTIPARSELAFEPGSCHGMLIDLESVPEEDSEVEITLTFERSGTRRLRVPVLRKQPACEACEEQG